MPYELEEIKEIRKTNAQEPDAAKEKKQGRLCGADFFEAAKADQRGKGMRLRCQQFCRIKINEKEDDRRYHQSRPAAKQLKAFFHPGNCFFHMNWKVNESEGKCNDGRRIRGKIIY